MSKVWYCPTCGYEVSSRGRCHSCGEKLVVSGLPPLVAGNEDDEVGYRLDTWADRDRGRLIVQLNHMAIPHRFEEDELVIGASDEERIDDLVAELAATAIGDLGGDDEEEEEEDDSTTDSPHYLPGNSDPVADPGMSDSVHDALLMLSLAARRLKADPTDMQADGDVAEASTAIFLADAYPAADRETWAAVGRVTRRLLSVLGAEEALEEDIRKEASVLDKLLAPLIGEESPSRLEVTDDESEQTVYELPDWTPEQKVQLGMLLDEVGIAYEWDKDELVIPSDKEDEVEALFSRVGGTEDDDDLDEATAEARYQAVAELFAASGRLASDPGDEQRSAAVLKWVHECQGPPLLGMDEVDWFRIMSRAKALAVAIEDGDDIDTVESDATTLHDLLRSVV